MRKIGNWRIKLKKSYLKSYRQMPGAVLALFLGTTSVSFAEPATPEDFRHAVYSATTAELFWQRVTGHPLVVGYELTKDSEVLGVFDALSYVDTTLVAGLTYRYSITAIQGNGERSRSATINVSIPATPQEQIANLQAEIARLQDELISSSTGVPAPIAATGETFSVRVGDDGDYQVGATVNGVRFRDNSDGTFTDRLTGLTWLGVRDCIVKMDWNNAIDYANGLADDGVACPLLTDGSVVGDWRLPNVRELQSFIDYSGYSPTLAEGIPYQGGSWRENPWTAYWSSTSFGPAPDLRAYSTEYESGSSSFHTNKTNNYYVWPVKF